MPSSLVQSGPPPRPIVLVALAFMAGLAVGLEFPVAGRWLFPAAGLCLGWSIYCFVRARKIHGPLPRSGRALLVALALVGWWQGGHLTTHDAAALRQMAAWTTAEAQGELIGVEGIVSREPQVSPDSVEIYLVQVVVRSMRVGGRREALELGVTLSARNGARQALADTPRALPLPGQRVRAWGRLRSLSAQTAPGVFNSERYWLSQSIGARMSLTRPADFELGTKESPLRAGIYDALRGLRGQVARIFERRLPAEQVPLARALFLGDAYLLSQEDREAFKSTGLAHLWAVSGLNTAFVLLVLLGLTRPLGLSTRASAWIGIAGLLFYAALTGFQPPVMRATVMGIFILFGMSLKRTATTLASLATAVFFTLLADPRNILRVDWQLSYICVLAVVLITPPLYDLFAPEDKAPPAAGEPEAPPRWNGLRRLLKSFILLPLATVLAVQMMLIPIQLYYFRQFNLLSPIHNIIGVDLSLIGMFGVMFTAILGWIPGVGLIPAWLTQWSLWLLTRFVHLAAEIPHVTLYLMPLPLLAMAAYYLILFGGSWLRTGLGERNRIGRQQVRSFGRTVALLFVIIAGAQMLSSGGGADENALDLYVLDVGQGDSLVGRFPNGKVMVIDAGNAAPADKGRLVVGPFLQTLGIKAIDCLVATHADADHIGGIPYLLQNFKVKLMVEGPDSADSNVYHSMQSLLRKGGIREQQVREGSSLKGFDPVQIKLLGPLGGMADNDASVVALVSYGQAHMLLTGDLETAGERRILEEGEGVAVDVLKLGHHGSRSSTSEEFLAALRPETALVSVGRNNRYGHPSKEVLRRLEAHEVQVCRTDQQGTLWVRTDGRRIQIYRYAGPE